MRVRWPSGLDDGIGDAIGFFEREEMAFHQRIRDGYLKLAADEPGRWVVIDACQTKGEIAGIIWQRVSQLLSRQGD